MKSPASLFGNLVRYVIFIALVLVTTWLKDMTFDQGKISGIFLVLCLAATALSLLFFIRQFNLEQRYFSSGSNSRPEVLSNAFGFLFLLVLIVGGLNLVVGWLQVSGSIPQFANTANKFDINDMGFWLNILIVGIALPVLQQFVATGFFFNYLFRRSTIANTILGMLFSGAIFAALQFQTSFMPIFLQFSLGCLFSLSYLYTRRLEVPICLNIFSAILMIVLA
ncbi:type II CAAX prenyl endopeptidase Rce1 family protein [Lapidilactobacillus mulanensis]|uniref:Type II CAAX prenyl endopeptidase Rce1 family protein n=1 Tax=Lapidilactobacillus mulanensis TaxID=2485999 RepID=A0ABW4DSG5_9LACO|nr:CPBP family glutamic-type intramembrane protease [Lapidilactobacillus mulanensis]